MTKKEAQLRLAQLLKGRTLTFSIKTRGDQWVAQCNEIDAIITCGRGYDVGGMHALMQDAIFSAAGIPQQIGHGLLKTVRGTNPVVLPSGTEIEQGSSIRPFESSYQLTKAGSYAAPR